MDSKTIHFKGLNALRFFAASAIILYHATQGFTDKLPAFAKLFHGNLTLGVDFFFIISGFLITYLLLIEKQKTQTISLRKFYIRRILRIFPLYYLIIAIAFFQYHDSQPEIDFAKFLYFFGNFWMIEINSWTIPILTPLWSICIEEHFYLIIPALILLIPFSKVKALFIGIIITSALFRVYLMESLEFPWMAHYLHTISRCDFLAFGGLLAHYYFEDKIKFRIKEIHIGLALIILIVLMSLTNSNHFSNLFFVVFKKYLFAILLIIILMGMIFNAREKGIIKWLNENRAINYLGKISYGLYMFHSVIGSLIIAKIPFLNQNVFLKTVSIFTLTIIISTLSFEFFEKQILKLKKNFQVVKTSN